MSPRRMARTCPRTPNPPAHFPGIPTGVDNSARRCAHRATGGPKARTHASLGQRPRKEGDEDRRAEGPIHCSAELVTGPGIQPLGWVGTVTWAVGPGWDEDGPLALGKPRGNRGLIDDIPLGCPEDRPPSDLECADRSALSLWATCRPVPARHVAKRESGVMPPHSKIPSRRGAKNSCSSSGASCRWNRCRGAGAF